MYQERIVLLSPERPQLLKLNFFSFVIMPVKLLDSNEGSVDMGLESSDEEILSIKRKKSGRIESDESDADCCDKRKIVNDNDDRRRSKSDTTIESNIPYGEEDLDRTSPHLSGIKSCTTLSSQPSNSVSEGEKRDFKLLFSNKDLYDSEDTDDDNNPANVNTPALEKTNHYDAEGSSDEDSKEQKLIKKPKPHRAGKPLKNIEEKKEIDVIHSETQRMVRHSRVSLPYHKPRQRTLAEFLQRRPSIPTKSIRMSTNELKLLGKQVAKRAKEAEEFYKSSSDEETIQPEAFEKKSNEELSTVHLLPKSETSNDVSQGKEMSQDINKDMCSQSEILCSRSIVEETSSLVPVNKNFKVNGNNLQISDRSEVFNRECEDQLEFQRSLSIINKNSEKHTQIENTESSSEPNEPNSSGIINDAPFGEDEMDTQDLCLRIEDTETCDEVHEKKSEEHSFSKEIQNIDNTETKSIDFETEKGEMTYGTTLNTVCDKDVQDLHLRLENSEHFDANNGSTGRKFSSEKFSKSGPNIISTKDYEKSVIQGGKIRQSVPVLYNEDFETQDLCLRIENTETLDSVANDLTNQLVKERKNSGVLENTLSDDRFLNVNSELYSFNKCSKSSTTVVEEEHQNACFFLTDRNTSKTLKNTNDNSETASNDDSALKKTCQRKLENFFPETELQSKDNVCASHDKESSTVPTTDLKIILEGEETRIAFETDCSMLNGKPLSSDESEKCVNLQKLVVQSADKTVFISEMSKSENADDKIELLEKRKAYSNQSHNFLLQTKEMSSDSREDVLKAIQQLRGDGGKDSKNVKLLRTMSLLEDRLQSSRKSFKLQNAVPQLKGSPSKVVHLDETPSSCDINMLKQRFLRHSLPKTPALHKTSKDVSVILAEAGPTGEVEVKKEVVTIESETENLLGSRSKLLKLKEELQKQIVKEREQEWNRRQLEAKGDSSYINEKSECGLLDEDDEYSVASDGENIDESEDDDDEDGNDDDPEEDEEEDEISANKNRNKHRPCAFVDDEAEVSDDMSDDTGNSDEDNLLFEPTLDTKSTKASTKDTKKLGTDVSLSSFKRMKTIDPFESQEVSSDITDESVLASTSLKRIKTSVDPSESHEVDTESSISIPPYQPGGAISQISDPVGEDPFINIVPPTLPAPRSEDGNSENGFSQFPQPSVTFNELGLQNSRNEPDADESELLDLCSGKFTSQPPDISQDDSVQSSELDSSFLSGKKIEQVQSSTDALSQTLKLQESNFSESEETNSLHRKEMEQTNEDVTRLHSRNKLVITSDDEEELDSKVKKKSLFKLQFSDDEDEDEEKNSRDELGFSDEDETQELGYDSEENEIVVPSAAKDFFENEAELSESDWGSADEDEKDLDDFEDEAGDEEKLDQSKVREQLGKIHMRRVLDEDQQEVRRLQELLLEDGEFHSEGGGRQRQFRWKNLNEADDLQFSRKTDGEIANDDEEEEDESEWRRIRFERETFLQEQKNSVEKEETLIESVKLKFKTPIIVPRKSGQIKRGSFLTRSETMLARIAQMANNSDEINLLAPTNSGNFVFATLSQDPKEDEKKRVKRKPDTTKVPTAKKMRMSVSLLDHI